MFPARHLLLSLIAATTVSAATINFGVTPLTGSREVPSNGSTATGSATVSYNDVTLILSVSVLFSGLTGGPATAAHIHCCLGPGVASGIAIGFTDFPNATSGNYSRTFDLNTTGVFNATFLANNGGTAAGARAALLSGLTAYRGYVNIHNADFPGGEIRGDFVPEPITMAMFGVGLIGIGLLRRRR